MFLPLGNSYLLDASLHNVEKNTFGPTIFKTLVNYHQTLYSIKQHILFVTYKRGKKMAFNHQTFTLHSTVCVGEARS
jgi:hypothetical protein